MPKTPRSIGLMAAAFPAVSVLSVLSVLLGADAALGESPRVVITGGADETQHQYSWEVTNRSNQRIVRIEFPQYGADLFHTPDTWKQGTQKEMNLVNVGWDYENPGVCWAEPADGYPGLAPGATATFGMRIAGMGALRSTGTVRVTFEDGSVAEIPGVELPAMPVSTSPWAALVGTGAIFVALIAYRELRRRKQPRTTEEWGEPSESAEPDSPQAPQA